MLFVFVVDQVVVDATRCWAFFIVDEIVVDAARF
jgi:hypothetical protein